MRVHQAGILLGLVPLAGLLVGACGPPPERESDGICGGSSPIWFGSDNSMHWTPDGSQILFSYSEARLGEAAYPDLPDIYAVHVSGDPVKKVLDLPSLLPKYPDVHRGDSRMVFDLSPDGSRIAYARCAISEETVQVDDGDLQVNNVEIFLLNSDGSDMERLTNNTYLDTLPAWSPDGESLAFISDPGRSARGRPHSRKPRELEWEPRTQLTIHEVATGLSREIGLPEGLAVFTARLEWSPSGDRIAFVALEGEGDTLYYSTAPDPNKEPWNRAVYMVGADGTGLTRVSDARSVPTWSPDGEAIAVVVPEGDVEEALYIFAADGSNLVKGKYDVSHFNRYTRIRDNWYGNISWSPDGSRILFEWVGERVSVDSVVTAGAEAGVAGGARARSLAGSGAGSILASPLNTVVASRPEYAWSPDGTQVVYRRDLQEFFDLFIAPAGALHESREQKESSRLLLEWTRDRWAKIVDGTYR